MYKKWFTGIALNSLKYMTHKGRTFPGVLYKYVVAMPPPPHSNCPSLFVITDPTYSRSLQQSQVNEAGL